MGIPSEIRAGDTVSWIESSTSDTLGNALTSAAWTLITYLRFNAASEAITVTGSARTDGGWDNTITAAASAGMNAGQWFWQTTATSASTVLTIGAGSLSVLPSLAYSGTATAFDGRSQAEIDLANVQAAIRAIVSKGARQYTIGSRSYTSLDLPALMELEGRLKAIISREQRAQKIAAGLGDPTALYVRFT